MVSIQFEIFVGENYGPSYTAGKPDVGSFGRGAVKFWQIYFVKSLKAWGKIFESNKCA